MRYPTLTALAGLSCALVSACSEPEPAEVVAQPPTVALVAIEADGDDWHAIYDIGNPNGYAITVEALHLGLTVAGVSEAACVELVAGGCGSASPDWPTDGMVFEPGAAPAAVTLPPRETTQCHAALEGCVVEGDMFCCDNGDGCKPLGDCFGRVTPEGSRCLVCPTHAELRLPFALDGMPASVTARVGVTTDSETGPALGVSEAGEIELP